MAEKDVFAKKLSDIELEAVVGGKFRKPYKPAKKSILTKTFEEAWEASKKEAEKKVKERQKEREKERKKSGKKGLFGLF